LFSLANEYACHNGREGGAPALVGRSVKIKPLIHTNRIKSPAKKTMSQTWLEKILVWIE
jgi:hypothetical protein